MSSPIPDQCPRCGNPVPADSIYRVCPNCLVAMNFATETVLTGEPSAALRVPFTPEELAPHFPQLEILECLGRGGMGVVYKARQRSLQRLVALKLLAPERVKEAAFAERFAREAQALAALNHPHIVTVHDFGQSGDFFYLLMEYVDGVNLRQASKAGRFTPEQALAVVPPICEALQYAHSRGIVHRDIKPENLLLDRAGQVKIADFGIAKILGSTASDIGVAESRAAGTPQYMAPEQIADPKSVDQRADIYSLGVVLYEMLTGELPKRRLEPPSQKVQVDVRLDQVVLRALQQQKEMRYGSALEFKTELENATGVVGASAPAPAKAVSDPAVATPSSPKSRSPRRRWLGNAAAAAVFIAIALYIIPSLVLPPEYFAKVTMEIKSEDVTNRALAQLLGRQAKGDESFISTQLQVLRKAEILTPVIKEHELTKLYGSGRKELSLNEAVQELNDRLVLQTVRNTGLIEIGVLDTDAERGAKIANSIAVVYKNRRLQDLQSAVERSLSQFRQEVEKQRKAVEEAAIEMAKMRETLGVVDPDPESHVAPLQIRANGISEKDAGTDYATAKARYLQRKKILEAAELRLSTAVMERGLEFDPAKIWEKAEPAAKPVGFQPGRALRRLLGVRRG